MKKRITNSIGEWLVAACDGDIFIFKPNGNGRWIEEFSGFRSIGDAVEFLAELEDAR